MRLALSGAIYSRITLSFALNRIFFSANENGTVKQNNQSDFTAFLNSLQIALHSVQLPLFILSKFGFGVSLIFRCDEPNNCKIQWITRELKMQTMRKMLFELEHNIYKKKSS